MTGMHKTLSSALFFVVAILLVLPQQVCGADEATPVNASVSTDASINETETPFDMAEYWTTSDAIHLGDSNFSKIVYPLQAPLDEQEPFFIMVYAPWCDHCKAQLPIVHRASSRVGHDEGVHIGVVDGTANPDLHKQLHMTAYPSYYFTFRGRMFAYKGFAAENAMVEFAKFLAGVMKQGTFLVDISIPQNYKYLRHLGGLSRPMMVMCTSSSLTLKGKGSMKRDQQNLSDARIARQHEERDVLDMIAASIMPGTLAQFVRLVVPADEEVEPPQEKDYVGIEEAIFHHRLRYTCSEARRGRFQKGIKPTLGPFGEVFMILHDAAENVEGNLLPTFSGTWDGRVDGLRHRKLIEDPRAVGFVPHWDLEEFAVPFLLRGVERFSAYEVSLAAPRHAFALLILPPKSEPVEKFVKENLILKNVARRRFEEWVTYLPRPVVTNFGFEQAEKKEAQNLSLVRYKTSPISAFSSKSQRCCQLFVVSNAPIHHSWFEFMKLGELASETLDKVHFVVVDPLRRLTWRSENFESTSSQNLNKRLQSVDFTTSNPEIENEILKFLRAVDRRKTKAEAHTIFTAFVLHVTNLFPGAEKIHEWVDYDDAVFCLIFFIPVLIGLIILVSCRNGVRPLLVARDDPPPTKKKQD